MVGEGEIDGPLGEKAAFIVAAVTGIAAGSIDDAVWAKSSSIFRCVVDAPTLFQLGKADVRCISNRYRYQTRQMQRLAATHFSALPFVRAAGSSQPRPTSTSLCSQAWDVRGDLKL